MDTAFNPELLRFGGGLDDGSELVMLSSTELLRIANENVRQRVSSLRLAAKIVGLTAARSGCMNDADVLEGIGPFMRRLSALRVMALAAIGVSRKSEDFAAVFNAVTASMLDVVAIEFKWSQVLKRNVELSPDVMKELLDSTVHLQPERFVYRDNGLNIGLVRRLAVFASAPKLYNLANYFDFFQRDIGRMVGRLMRACVDAAEVHAATWSAHSDTAMGSVAVYERIYAVSVDLMAEVYKVTATEKVLELSRMNEHDRSLSILHYEEIGGMPMDVIMDRHAEAMTKMVETASLIAEAQEG